MNRAKRNNLISVLLAVSVIAVLFVYVQSQNPVFAVSVSVEPLVQNVVYGDTISLSGYVSDVQSGYEAVLILKGANGFSKEFSSLLDSSGRFSFFVRFNQDFNPIYFGSYSDNYVEVRDISSGAVVGKSPDITVVYVGA